MSGTALQTENVLVGTARGPGVFLGPKGTALPGDTTEAPGAGFRNVGFISDEAVKIATDISQEDLFVWQAVSPIRSVITERSLTFELTLVETSPDTLAIYFDTAAPVGDITTGYTVNVPAVPLATQYAAIIDVLDGTAALRFCFEQVTLSEAGEIEITRSGLIGYPVTMKVLASPNNNVHVGPATL